MKKVKIVTPVDSLVLGVIGILGIGIAIGIAIGAAIPKEAQIGGSTWPLPSAMEDIYPFESPQPTLDDYLSAAYADAQEMSQYLDIAFPGAKVMWSTHGGFSSKEEIADFLSSVEFGCCRHRVAYAYWLLQALYPTKEIKAIVGYVYAPALMAAKSDEVPIRFSEQDHLTSNHAWLTIDGEVFDPALNPETVRYYHPYGWCFYQKKVEWVDNTPVITEITFPQYDIVRGEVEEQYRYDKGLQNTPKEDIPPWWYQ